MSVDDAFDRFSDNIGPDAILYLFARAQRNRFMDDLEPAPEINQIISVGSLAHGTGGAIPKDVDLLVEMPKHVLYGLTPAEALELTQKIIRARVYHRAEDDPGLFNDTRLGDHVVQCDWGRLPLGDFEGLIPEPPPVDVMPAYRDGTRLYVPERSSNTWKPVDPERMTRLVKERQLEWEHFDDVVRMVKAWNKHHHLGLKSVAVEVLVLIHMPRPKLGQTLTRAEALAQFFENAHRDLRPLRTPGTGYLIDPTYLYGDLRAALKEAAGHSREAVEAEAAGDIWLAEDRWQRIFGDAFGPGWLIMTLRWIWGQRRPDTAADLKAGRPDPGRHASPTDPRPFNESHSEAGDSGPKNPGSDEPNTDRSGANPSGPRGSGSGGPGSRGSGPRSSGPPGSGPGRSGSGGSGSGGSGSGGSGSANPRSGSPTGPPQTSRPRATPGAAAAAAARVGSFFARGGVGQVPKPDSPPLFG